MENNTTTKIYNECCNIIKEMIEKYKDNTHMVLKIQNHICLQFPNLLKTMEENYIQQQKRLEGLTIEQEAFIHKFLK